MPPLQVAADRRPFSFSGSHPAALSRKAPRVKPKVVGQSRSRLQSSGRFRVEPTVHLTTPCPAIASPVCSGLASALVFPGSRVCFLTAVAAARQVQPRAAVHSTRRAGRGVTMPPPAATHGFDPSQSTPHAVSRGVEPSDSTRAATAARFRSVLKCLRLAVTHGCKPSKLPPAAIRTRFRSVSINAACLFRRIRSVPLYLPVPIHTVSIRAHVPPPGDHARLQTVPKCHRLAVTHGYKPYRGATDCHSRTV